MTKRNITYQLNIAISNAIASRKTRAEYEQIAYEMHQAALREEMAEEATKNETQKP
jgi:hypothetical protein